MTTRHHTHTTCIMPASQAGAIHDALTAEVAPQCERHFDTDPTHTVDGTDYTRVAWVVRPEVAAALVAIQADPAYDLRINPRPTPYANVDFPPMPDPGERIERGQVYDADGALYLARQSGPRTEHEPDDVPAIFAAYRTGDDLDWQPNGEMLAKGDVRTYEGDEWIVRQAHQALQGRAPDVYQAGWWRMKPITAPGDGPPEWATQVDYAVGDHVMYDGTEYECIQAHTSLTGWNPPAVPALWSLV